MHERHSLRLSLRPLIYFDFLRTLRSYSVPLTRTRVSRRKGAVMSKKLVLVAVVVAGALLFAFANQTTSSADAASGDCYSGDKGPDAPTICQ